MTAEQTREPVIIDADPSGVEGVALELRKERETPRLPEDAQELVDATVGADGVFELLKREVRDIDDTVPPLGSMQDLLDEADDRVASFLIRETTKKKGKEQITEYHPRSHVEQLVKMAIDENINGEVQELMVQLQDRLYSDIHGIMVRFHKQAEQKLPEDHPLRKSEAIADALCSGTIQTHEGFNQRVHTIFGAYRHMREARQCPLKALDLTGAEKPATISVINPLYRDQSGYWMVQKKASEQYREKKDRNPTLSQLIFEHSERATHALEDKLDELEEKKLQEGGLSEEEKKLYNAYLTLSNWISKEAARFNRRMSDSELEFRAGLLFFGASDEKTAKGGDVDNFATLFNAAETVKQMDHELFLRLAGVAPAHEQYRHGEVARSDLFGSVFQIALYNSLQMSDVNGYSKRIRGLTEIGTSQTRFLPLFSSVSDIEALDKRIAESQGAFTDDMQVDVKKAAKEGRSAATAVAVDVPMMVMLQSWREAVAVQRALVNIESKKSQQILERIRAAKDSKEYMALLDDLPEYMYVSKSKERRQTKYDSAVREAAAESGARLYLEARPNSFVALLRWMPYELLVAQPVMDSLRARVNSRIYDIHPIIGSNSFVRYKLDPDRKPQNSRHYQNMLYSQYRMEVHSMRIDVPIHNANLASLLLDIVRHQDYSELETVLWETALDEAVLEDNGSESGFFSFVEKLMANEADKDRAKKLMHVAAAHREITDVQWKTWFEKCVERQTSVPLTRAKPAYEEIIDRWKGILSQIRPTAVLAGPISRFFCLQKVISLYDLEKVRSAYYKREGESGKKLRQDIERIDQENCPQAERINLDQTFIERDSFGCRYPLYAYGLTLLLKEEYLAEREVILDPVKAAVVEFRCKTADMFTERFHSEMMDLDKQMHLTARQLGEFVHQLERDEAQLLLVEYFESKSTKIGYEVFNPFNPWQLEILRLAEEFIPDNQNYQAAIYALEHKTPGESFPTNWQTDGRFMHNSEQKPTKGKPYLYENGEVGFLSPDGKILRRPVPFCWPRYVQDEQKRWHAEWLDPDTNEWQRIKD